MDSLKFRCYNITDECYLNDDEFYLSPDGEGVFFSAEHDMIDCVIEKCTGIKDRYRDLIYEGDIVQQIVDPEDVYVIRWDDNIASFSIDSVEEGGCSYTFDNFSGDDFQIIGNIHENKELLGAVDETND